MIEKLLVRLLIFPFTISHRTRLILETTVLPSVGDRVQDSNAHIVVKKTLDSTRELATNETINPYQSSVMNQSQPPTNWFRQMLNGPTPSGRLTAVIAVPALVALGISLYLAFTSLTSSSVAGCSGLVFDCSSVLKSRWSVWFGIPVSILAATTYIVLLGSLVLSQFGSTKQRNAMWMSVIICSFSAGLAALWFIGLQKFVVGHWCQYCLVAHGCGLFLSAVLLFQCPLGMAANFRFGMAALVGLVVISGGQYLSEGPQTYTIKTFDGQYLNSLPSNSESSETMSPPMSPLNGVVEPVWDDESLFEAPVGPATGAEPAGEGDIFEAPQIFEAPADEPGLKQTKRLSPTARAYVVTTFVSSMHTMVTVQASTQPTPATIPTQQSNTIPAAKQQSAAGTEQNQTGGQNATSQNPNPTANSQQTANDPAAKPAAATEAPVVRRLAAINGGRIKLDVNQWPLVGNPDANYVVVEMFDYACPHCRHTHQNAIKGAQTTMQGDLAILALPLPLNNQCNPSVLQNGPLFFESCPTAKLALAVWRVDPAKFTDFHNWMFIGPSAPNYLSAKQYAETLVDPTKLATELASGIPEAFIAKHVKIYEMTAKGNVPKLMFPTTSIEGEFGSPDALVTLIKEQGPIVPVEVPAQPAK